MQLLERFRTEVEERRAQHLLRTLQVSSSAPGPTITIAGRELINLSSNNYLGLATHPALAAGSARAVELAGSGAGASRLLTGTHSLHEAVERQLADFLGEEAALLFSSGYAANVGIIPALAGRGDRIFSDALNHASIIDGCRLSRAEVTIYPHGDTVALEHLVQGCPPSRGGARLIVSESLFSMDGDAAPVTALSELARRHDTLLLLDEAHALGAIGRGGRGLADLRGVSRPCLRLGTLGKAFGSAGAFLAGPACVIAYLTNTCRSFVYSTAVPAAILGAVAAALPLVEAAAAARQRLQARAAHLREGLRRLGFSAPAEGWHIVPVLAGEAERALAWSAALAEAGVLALPIRPPTVPDGTARLRLAPSAAHSAAQIDQVLEAFARLAQAAGGGSQPSSCGAEAATSTSRCSA
ncbi:MAG: 8-amino-7-oxononanoate synthase [Candidatus Tectomicrobia bacterium]|nr:8-amino-7-oxononanoate synthase [Candidatus Tectomicrobia bacterium]